MDETSNPDSEFEYDTDSEKRSAKSKAKKRRYTQKYTTVWEKSHTWIKKSRISDSQFYCTVCHKNYICGTTEVLRHGKSTSHVKKAVEQKKQPNIMQVTSGICTEVRQIKEAELRISAFIAEHNLSFATADHLPKLIKTIWPDSTIATKISCAREKCSGIIKNVLGDYRLNSLINELRKTKFSLLVDEATDIGGTKHLSLVVRIKESNGRVRDQFLTLLQISSGSANDMYNAIQQYFETNNINYKENMVGFAADGTNSMFGNNHSLCTLLKRGIPKLFTLTCVCHSFALCASYACKELPDGVEQLCREIYKY